MIAFLASAFQAFGIYNIHVLSNVTEGGVLGLVLLGEHCFGISPAVSGFVLNMLCYLLGWKTLGKGFIVCSMAAAAGFSAAYGIIEQYPPLWPQIADYPLLAAVLGALFIGIGAGISVKVGGAAAGDDALAMSLSKITGVEIQWVYLISDVSVLLLSLVYIPLNRIGYSLLTVILSGQIIGLIQKMPNTAAKKQSR
ncbi:MAG: YitT family protein [Oscillospiraceae bacterium]|nr:YitT family protein [Oscillospiraceae bacterium]